MGSEMRVSPFFASARNHVYPLRELKQLRSIEGAQLAGTVVRRELRDPVHGFIARSDVEQQLIDSPVFQRLRRIRQLALASLVYPGALHTRFEHSIGAMYVAGRIADAVGLEDEEKRLVRLAALLHDVGHGPFSHVSEPILETFASVRPAEPSKQIHEALTKQIILTDKDLARLLSDYDREKITKILAGEYGDSLVEGIVSGPLDADKQDYLLRDSYFCGVKYGLYDLDRLIGTFCTYSDKSDRYLAIKEDGINAPEQFVLAKYYMTAQVYRHKIRSITDLMIDRAIRLGIEEDGIEWLKRAFTWDGSPEFLEAYKSWTDDRLINEVLSERTPEGYAKRLFSQLAGRRLHKRVAKVRVAEFADPLVRNRLASLTRGQMLALERKVGELLSVDPNLVMVRIFVFDSVREQSRNSESSILVVTEGRRRKFEEGSQLFRSIDEASKETIIEVYAPVTYPGARDKAERQREYQSKIRQALERIGGEVLEEGKDEA